MASPISATSTATSTAGSTHTASAQTNVAESQDRFLKLLVAQLGNQDPMNPMDNAQMTSQMAQINTVTGIQQVNQSIQAMAAQFASLQALQGAAMVGRDVLVEGATLQRGSDGVSRAALDLQANADRVTVEVLSPGGQVLGTLELGPLNKGRHDFEWNAASDQGSGELSYRVTASSGGSAVASTSLMRSRVVSVAADNGALQLQLQDNRLTAYSSVKAIF